MPIIVLLQNSYPCGRCFSSAIRLPITLMERYLSLAKSYTAVTSIVALAFLPTTSTRPERIIAPLGASVKGGLRFICKPLRKVLRARDWSSLDEGLEFWGKPILALLSAPAVGTTPGGARPGPVEPPGFSIGPSVEAPEFRVPRGD
jgi:hypothetical protein